MSQELESTNVHNRFFDLNSPVVRRRLFFFISALSALFILRPVLTGLLLGATLAFLSEPLKKQCERLFQRPARHLKSVLASLSTVVLISVVFLLPFSAVIIGAVERISISLASLATTQKLALLEELLSRVKELNRLLPINVNPEQLTNVLLSAAQRAMAWLGQATGQWLTELPATLLTATLALISWGYLLINGRKLRIVALRFLFPWPSERSLLRSTFAQMLKSLVLANIFVSVIQSVIIALFMISVGVPHVLLWASSAFFLSFIPVIGTLPITLGGALWCWTTEGHLGKTIAMLIGALVAGTSDNFIRPLMARGVGELNPFWLFLAMMGGLAQFGPLGFLLGPLALALTIASGAALRETLKFKRKEKSPCET